MTDAEGRLERIASRMEELGIAPNANPGPNEFDDFDNLLWWYSYSVIGKLFDPDELVQFFHEYRTLLDSEEGRGILKEILEVMKEDA